MVRSLMLAVVLATGAVTGAQAAQQEKSPKMEAAKADLFIAIRDRDVTGVKTALAHGADPNGRNWLDFTPLMWAAARGNTQIAETLLAQGAKLEGSSIYGSALTFATIGRHEKMALYLLGKGAKTDPTRVDGAMPLMLAAANGSTSLIERLIQKKSDPNKKDVDGATALIYAARLGQANAVHVLLKAGADVNIADSHGRTALMYAAANSYPKAVELLLANHAAVNAKDKRDATALLLAARYSGDAEIVRSLLKAGANTAAKDGSGWTPLALAQARGFDEATVVLRKAGAQTSPAASHAITYAPLNTRQAVEKSLTVLQTGMKGFAQRAQCTSCHHQGLGLMTVGLAAQRGFAVDKELVGGYLMRMGKEGQENAPFVHQAVADPNIAKMVPAVDIGDFSIGGAYIFSGILANRIPANPGFAEMALLIAAQQAADGHWGFGFDREPIQSSYVTTTALVLQVLRAYGPQDKLASTYAQAKQWLLTTPAPNAEDKASRLMGLQWAGASKEEMEKPLSELLAAQRADGGWTQLPTLHSDAYATGMALYALKVAGGMSADEPAFQRGVQFLLRTQDEDGSWYVNKRTMPANTYFDAGFPNGESQYISFGATCWATMALLQATDAPQSTARR